MKDFGFVTLNCRTVPHSDGYFNAKLVFDGLEEFLKNQGQTILQVSTREHLPGTPLAIRVELKPYKTMSEAISIILRIIGHSDKYFNSKLVFKGLIGELKKRGIDVVRSETRATGRGSDLALRVHA